MSKKKPKKPKMSQADMIKQVRDWNTGRPKRDNTRKPKKSTNKDDKTDRRGRINRKGKV
jgi:hypothetical protein